MIPRPARAGGARRADAIRLPAAPLHATLPVLIHQQRGAGSGVRIKFWGVRGSIPTPLTAEQLNDKLFQALSGAVGVNLADPAEVQAYIAGLPPNVRSLVGGNTSCVQIDTGSETIIVDCGSGMRALGMSLMSREFGRGQGTAHIFLTHAHWDHLQGLPFFAPAYVPGNRLIFYAVNQSAQAFLEHQQVAPTYFPIAPSAMPATKEYVQLREGATLQIGRTVVSSLSLYHPGTAYAYRFDDGESVFVFASDGEYKSLTEASLRRYVAFFSEADVLVFDAQYSLRDVFLSKADWGHSSAIIGVDIAERASVKRLVTFHHDPTHTDSQVYAIADAARDYALVNEIEHNTEVIVGTEGLELVLGQQPGLEVLQADSNGLVTVALAGALDAATASQARAHLAAALAGAGASGVLLDLTLLSSADAIGLKELLEATRARPHPPLAVLAVSSRHRQLLELLGASERLHIVRTRSQAEAALAGQAHQQLANALIGNRYQLDDLWFVDERGAVYRAHCLDDHSPLVVRALSGKAGDPRRQRFVSELRAWGGLHHPNLFLGLDIVEADHWAAFVGPAPAGTALRDWQSKTQAWAARWSLALRLCQALAAVHGAGMVHGDLRPEHVVVGAHGPCLSPVRLVPAPPGLAPTAYLSPEQLRGKPAGPPSDVYALGVLFYELLVGTHPFAAGDEDLQLTLQLYSQPQSPRVRWPEIAPELEAFLLRLLALDPLDRPADAVATLAECEALTAGIGGTDAAPTPPD
jgi:phosphoribosyl 1,2-cyclic phosphodiesterase/anti-anti-sigma regulatory factor